MPYASINGQNIYYEDSGGRGDPIFMMHGFLMDQSLFDHQVAVLSSNYRCVRFDARAFGKTLWDEKEFTLYDTVSDCIGLMNFLKIPCATIFGMSQGGYAALRLAIKHPDRVKALVLMSTQSGIDDGETIAQFKQMRDTWVNVGPIEPLIEGLATVLLGPKDAMGMEAIWNHWLPKWKDIPKQAIQHAMNNLIYRDDITAYVSKIKQPAIVTHGEEDMGMPISLGRTLSNNLKNCKGFFPIKNAAHAANFTHPQRVNEAILKFLRIVNADQAIENFTCNA
jgi:3-oxoadipate enol-lactonase